MSELLRYLCPDEHSAKRLLNIPPNPLQSPDKGIPPFSVCINRLLHTILRTVKRYDTGNLYRLKNTIVKIALYLRKRPDHLPVPNTETNPPSGHIVALGH